MKGNKYFKILSFVIIIIIVMFFCNNIFAAINPDNIENSKSTGIKDIIGFILGAPTGALTAALAGLVNAIVLIIFVILYFVFSPVSAGLGFPFPDQIIFNKIGFFDPNFLNGPKYENGEYIANSPINILTGNVGTDMPNIIGNIYYTCFIIAGAIFVIAAMIMGIKLAISTIASEKAHYKQALTSWVFGIILLFTTHFLIAGIFAVNEEIVKTISDATSDIKFKINIKEMIPFLGSTVGKAISGFFGAVGSLFKNSEPKLIEVQGYGGLILMFAGYGIGGDLVSSIICAILLGQTCTLIVMYLKRLFYCILLGMIAPLIVAADIMKKM